MDQLCIETTLKKRADWEQEKEAHRKKKEEEEERRRRAMQVELHGSIIIPFGQDTNTKDDEERASSSYLKEIEEEKDES